MFGGLSPSETYSSDTGWFKKLLPAEQKNTGFAAVHLSRTARFDSQHVLTDLPCRVSLAAFPLRRKTKRKSAAAVGEAGRPGEHSWRPRCAGKLVGGNEKQP